MNPVLSIAAWFAAWMPLPVKRSLYKVEPLAKFIREALNRAAPSGLTNVEVAGGSLAGFHLSLDLQSEKDYWLPKPRFSAFLNTGLENWLREKSVTLCAVAGIATHICVLTTAMDAICHDFKAVLLADCCAAPFQSIHEHILNVYRRNPLYPLLKVASSAEFIAETIDGIA